MSEWAEAGVTALLSTAARIATLAISLVCGILTSRLAIGGAGVEYYAFLSLLVALPGLVMFSDLGAGAVVVTSVAKSKNVRSDELVQRQVLSVMRIMLLFAASLATVNVLLLLTGSWSLLLGTSGDIPHADLAAFCCVSIYCLTICLGVWQRLLLGLRKNPLIILLQGMISPIALLIVWLLITSQNETLKSFLALGSFVATALVAVVGFVTAATMTRPLLIRAVRQVWLPRRYPGAKVMDVGLPMLAQMLTNPIAVAVPRYVLAILATPVAVAQYALAGQVFFAVQALIAAAGVALWPHFARARHAGELTRGPYLLSALFGSLVALITFVLLFVGPQLFGFISDGQLVIGNDLIIGFGIMMVMQALLYPLGMFIMDKPGIRFQVMPSLLMAVSTVVLAVVWVPTWGVLGPVAANAVSVLVFQIVPYAVYIRRHRSRLYGTTAGA